MTTLFLRNQNNQSVVDIDIWTKCEDGHDFTELSATVCIIPYSKLLLANQERAKEVMHDFDQIEELRGWLWESFLHTKNDGTRTDGVIEKVTEMLEVVAKKYDLRFVQD